MPLSLRARSRTRPAGPTNGRPCLSSWSPGDSPTRTIAAFVLPSPNTVAVARWYRSQRVHDPALCTSSAQVVTADEYPARIVPRLRAVNPLIHAVQELPAGSLAAPAGLLAHPAVRVHLGMPLALVAAALADSHAGLQQRPGDLGVIARRSADDRAGGGADIGAVQAQPDAHDHLGHVRLAQVRVDVGDTGLLAVADRVDGRGQQGDVSARRPLVAVQHLPGVAHGPSLASG